MSVISMISSRTTLQTLDGVSLVGDWTVPQGASRAVLLLHMMPATRGSFMQLSQVLNEAGFATLAIDLRGHGESTIQQMPGENSGVTLDYKKFTDKEHQASRLDVDAAMNFIKKKGFAEETISFVGASIGANLSLDALYRYKSTPRAVLLSPGLDYRGVVTELLMKGLNDDEKVWIIVAEGDEYSATSSKKLAYVGKDAATVTILSGKEHGTDLFMAHPQLIKEVVAFIKS